MLVLLVRREIATEMAEEALRRRRGLNTAEPTGPGLAGIVVGERGLSNLKRKAKQRPAHKINNQPRGRSPSNNHSTIFFLRRELYESTHVHFIIPSPWPPSRKKLKRSVRCIRPSAERSGGDVSTPLFGSESAEQHHGELLGARADVILHRLYPEQSGHSYQIQKCRPDFSEGLGGSLCSLCCWREGCDNLRKG
jgi:hypothetical protein